MNKTKLLSLLMIATGIGLVLSRPTGNANAETVWPTSLADCQARFPEGISFCHATHAENNPYNFHYNQPCTAAFGSGHGNSGHFEEDGTPAAGHEFPEIGTADYFTDDRSCGQDEPVCEETVTCSDACRVEDETIRGNCGPIVCEANAPEVETCPSECGYQGGLVSNGECGYIECSATENCEEEASPTPTPTPVNNTKNSFSTIDPSCDSNAVTAIEKITKNGQNKANVRVVFKYNGVEKIAFTDTNGEAKVSFDYTGDNFVDVMPDGFASDAHYVTKETNCSETPSENGQVLGTSTEGQVLGATTYAETGIAEDVMMSILGLAGAGMFSTGLVLNVKKK